MLLSTANCQLPTANCRLPNWGADGPVGAARVPTIVLSHSVPSEIPAGSVYTFVDSAEAAYEKAQQAAGDRAIGISGAIAAQALIQRGLIDEIIVHIVPVLFGSGVRFFESAGGAQVPLEILEVINTPEVVHLRYRVVK